ncbi:hypothetical protein SAMN05216436_105217 [bacterium A37T11]|nr:hypothetical protein SAMN05216436_105217 [bacterium A37T11]
MSFLYPLNNQAEKMPSAYVGETTDAQSRFANHLHHPDKQKLTQAYLISSDKFNKSATLDLEANLIKYLSGDGKYQLLNANLGLANHRYYQKDEVYAAIFRAVWDDLRQKNIAQHSLEYIDNSDLFKYSPYKSLSPDQTLALITVMQSLLDDRYRHIVIEGGAGTGKTILAVFLFKLLQTHIEDFYFGGFGADEQPIVDLVKKLKQKYPNPNMALVIPMASFRQTVKKIFKHVKGLQPSMVIGPADLSRNKYDIVFVDESHRLRQRVNLGAYFRAFDEASQKLGFDSDKCNELDWVVQQSDKAILFYDEDQSIKPSDAPKEAFDRLKNHPQTQTKLLDSQFRVRGGPRYVRFITQLLHGRLPKGQEPIKLKDYDFKQFHSLQALIDHIKQKNQQEKLARMVAGYAWPWVSKKNPGAADIHINDLALTWNSTSNDWINSPNAIHEVGCIHTTQGYDLNYTGIIFGPEIGYDTQKQEIIIHRQHYYDRNGKDNVKNPEQLKAYILHIYKTLMLRGIRGTYLYICDEALRDYVAQYVPWADQAAATVNDDETPLEPYINSVPLYDLKAAAGGFSELQQVGEDTDWIRVPIHIPITKDHFACQVVGESMNKVIPNGSICLFRKDNGGSRNGKIVLVEHSRFRDAAFGANYTIKEYHSQKHYEADGTWAHDRILLKPLSDDPTYQPIVLKGDELTELKVVGLFEGVLQE